MSLKDAQHFIYHLCGDYPFSYDAVKAELAPAVAAHLDQASDEHRMIYRRLVYASTEEILENALPVFCALLGEAPQADLVRTFLHQYKPRTRFYRDIPRDFINFLPTNIFAKKPPFPCAMELADYEFCDYDLLFRENISMPAHALDMPLDHAKPAINPHLYLKRYRYPVHRLQKDSDPSAISPQDTALVLWRDPVTFKIDTFELDALNVSVLQNFLDYPDTALGLQLERLRPAFQHLEEDTFIANSLACLQSFLDKKIVLAMV